MRAGNGVTSNFSLLEYISSQSVLSYHSIIAMLQPEAEPNKEANFVFSFLVSASASAIFAQIHDSVLSLCHVLIAVFPAKKCPLTRYEKNHLKRPRQLIVANV